jgi:hypothetical protein
MFGLFKKKKDVVFRKNAAPVPTGDIFRELGLDTLPQKQKEALALKMTEALLKRINLIIMERLSEKDIESYEKLADNNVAPHVIETFLKSKIPDYEVMVNSVIREFVDEMKKDLG